MDKLIKEKEKLQNKIDAITNDSEGKNEILNAIEAQKWYFFKNKPKILFDKTTGLLWPNLDYFPYTKGDDEDKYYSVKEAKEFINDLIIENFSGWKIPITKEFWEIITCDQFPFGNKKEVLDSKVNSIKEHEYWFINSKNKIKIMTTYIISYEGFQCQKPSLLPDEDKDDPFKYIPMMSARQKNEVNKRRQESPCLMPNNSSLVSEDYKINISEENKIYNRKEKLKMILDIFIDNNLIPIFNDEEVTDLYEKHYIKKTKYQKKLEEINNKINQKIGKTKADNKSFESLSYNEIINDYEIESIDKSIIRYADTIVSIINKFIVKIREYVNDNKEVIDIIEKEAQKALTKYENYSSLNNEENKLLQERHDYLRKEFSVNLNHTKNKLLSIKVEAKNIIESINEINLQENIIENLAELENKERASFQLVVENIIHVINRWLKKIEFYSENIELVKTIVDQSDTWILDYGTFKIDIKEKFIEDCQDDSVDLSKANEWYEDWKKKRFSIEKSLLPLFKYFLDGNLLDNNIKVINLLIEYKEDINEFYINERKNIYQKFAFTAAGDLQEKFETESELYKISIKFQRKIQSIIFSSDNIQDRLFLVKWSESLLNLGISDILEFIHDKELDEISSEVINSFIELKANQFENYLSDSKAYSQALNEREKQYNSLMFKMRKDLTSNG